MKPTGSIDELIVQTGLLRDYCNDSEINGWLLIVQDKLMIMAALLAYDKSVDLKLPNISENDVIFLEQQIDKIEELVEPLNNFILPGGHVAVSQAHVCRTVCRRAERRIVELAQQFEVDPVILKYINRLSDFFFMIGRLVAKRNQIHEVKWIPRKD